MLDNFDFIKKYFFVDALYHSSPNCPLSFDMIKPVWIFFLTFLILIFLKFVS